MDPPSHDCRPPRAPRRRGIGRVAADRISPTNGSATILEIDFRLHCRIASIRYVLRRSGGLEIRNVPISIVADRSLSVPFQGVIPFRNVRHPIRCYDFC
jgi:riboflavin biosynthesis pyrimidine reductase